MEASKRVVFVSVKGRDDSRPRTRRKRALGCVSSVAPRRRRRGPSIVARARSSFLGDDDESNGVFFVLSPRPSTASSSDPSSRGSPFIASSHRAAPRLASPLTPSSIPPSLPPSLRSVSETATWDEFVALIRARLQLENVRAIYHASTMTPLTSMNDLQDIEDLVVDGDEAASVSIPIPATSTGGSNGGAAAAGTGAAAKASGEIQTQVDAPEARAQSPRYAARTQRPRRRGPGRRR